MPGLRGLAIALIASSVMAATPMADEPAYTQGEWKIAPADDDREVQLELHRSWRTDSGRGNSRHSFEVRREELSGISGGQWSSSNAPVDFSLRRDAGALHLEGTLRHGRGAGDFSFEPNAKFQAELRRAGYEEPTPEDLLTLALHDIGFEWIQGFARRDGIELRDLIRFKVHGIDPEYVSTFAAAGYRDLTPSELVRLKVHGIDPEYVRGMGTLGSASPTANELVRLKSHGVEPAYVREMLALASPKPSFHDVVRLKIHGVEPSYVREFRSMGYQGLGAEQLVRLKIHGVSPTTARRARTRYGDVTVEQLIRLNTRGEI